MTDAHSPGRRVLIVAIVVLAAVASVRYGVVSWLDRMDPNQPFPYPGDHLGDYKDAVWLPGRDLLAGRDPYDSVAFARAHPGTQGYSPYTPSHLLVAALFAPLRWSIGAAVWTALSATAITIMGVVTARRVVELAGWVVVGPARAAAAGLGVVGAWAWRPDAMAIGLGQPTAIYGSVSAVVGLLVLSPRTKRRAPTGGVAVQPSRLRGAVAVGMWTALSLAKPQVGLQTVLTLSWAGRWRALGVAVMTTALLSLGVAAILAGGPTHLTSWLVGLPGHLQSAPSRFAVPGDNPWVDVSATAYRAGLRQGVATLFAPVLALALLSCGWVAATRLRGTGRPWLGALALTLAGLAAIPHAVYDDLLLYSVVLMAAAEAWRVSRESAPPSTPGPDSASDPAVAPPDGHPRWDVATVLLALVIGAVPNRIPVVAVEPGAVVGVLLLGALGCAIVASRPSTWVPRPAAHSRAAPAEPFV